MSSSSTSKSMSNIPSSMQIREEMEKMRDELEQKMREEFEQKMKKREKEIRREMRQEMEKRDRKRDQQFSKLLREKDEEKQLDMVKQLIEDENKYVENEYTDAQRANLLELLVQKYPYITSMRNYLRDIQNRIQAGDITPVEIYYAPPQAGKTLAGLIFSYMCTLLNFSTVFITMNRKNHIVQLGKRVYEFSGKGNSDFELSDILELSGLDSMPVLKISNIEKYNRVNGVVDFEKFEKNARKNSGGDEARALSIFRGETFGIISCMGNTYRLKILSQFIEHYNMKYTMCGDELDALMPVIDDDELPDIRKMDRYYFKIHKGAAAVVGTTATTLKIWLGLFSNFKRIHRLPITEDYISYDDLVVDTRVFANCDKLVKTSDFEVGNLGATVVKLVYFMKNFVELPQYHGIISNITKKAHNHPRVVGVYASTTIDHHSQLFGFIKRYMLNTYTGNKHCVVITWNSDEGGIKLFSSRLSSTNRKLHIKNFGQPNEDSKQISKGVYQFNNSSISDVLSLIEDLSNNEFNMGNIIIISGYNLDRSMSLLSNTYTLGLTDFVCIGGKKLDQLLQIVGRLFGRYRHFYNQIVFRLWTTIKIHDKLPKHIETISQLNKHGEKGCRVGRKNLQESLAKGDIKIPAVCKVGTAAFNTKVKKVDTKLGTKIYDTDAGSKGNINATFTSKYVSDKHDAMYAVGAKPGYKHRRTFRKDRANFVKSVGHTYPPPRAELAKYNQNVDEEKEEKEEKENKEGDEKVEYLYYKINKNNVNIELYNSIYQVFANEKNGLGLGVWKTKTTILTILTDISVEQENIRSKTWHWTQVSRYFTKVQDETTLGMLFRKQFNKNQWLIRVN